MEGWSDVLKIAVFTKNRTNPAYAAARLGADRAARALEAQAIHYVPETPDDAQEQSALIDEALSARPDAIAMSPVHPSRVDPAIRRIRDAGIPLVAFVNPIEAAPCVSTVGSDDSKLGFAIGGYLFGHLQGKGCVLVVTGHSHSVTSIERVRGFQRAAGDFPGIVLAGPCVGNYDRRTARQEVARWLAAHPREALHGCLVANDIMALGVLEALRDDGRSAAVVGVNAIPEAITEIREGRMLASADFNAMKMGYLATECAIRHLRGHPVPKVVELPVQIVDRGNCQLWDRPYEDRAILTLAQLGS
jgi:ribose transport system substrate-binding protein